MAAAAGPKMAKKKFGAAGVLLVLWVASFVVAAATETTAAEQKATNGASLSGNNGNGNDATSASSFIANAVGQAADQLAAERAARRDPLLEDVMDAGNQSLKQVDAAEKKAKRYKHASYGLAGVTGLGSLAGLFAAINVARKADSEAGLSKVAKGAGAAAAITALLGLGGAVFSTIQKKKAEDKMRARARHLLLLREVLGEKARQRAEVAERLSSEWRVDDDAEVEEAKKEEAALWNEADRWAAGAKKAGLFVPELFGQLVVKGESGD